jgi:hypothetical protein
VSKPSIKKKCEELLALEPNWDGEGGPKISPKAVKFMQAVLADYSPSSHPDIVPLRGGDVQAQWEQREEGKSKYLEIEFHNDGSIAYLIEYVNGGKLYEERGECRIFLFEKINQLFDLYNQMSL